LFVAVKISWQPENSFHTKEIKMTKYTICVSRTDVYEIEAVSFEVAQETLSSGDAELVHSKYYDEKWSREDGVDPYDEASEDGAPMIVVKDIDWDTDGDDVDLPETVKIPASEIDEESDEDAVADWLSDRYGYCVESYEIDEKTAEHARPSSSPEKQHGWEGGGVILPNGTVAEMIYNKQVGRAKIHNGRWSVAGQLSLSPSDAAGAAVLTRKGKRPSINGWIYWRVKRPNDEAFILLDELRKAQQ